MVAWIFGRGKGLCPFHMCGGHAQAGALPLCALVARIHPRIFVAKESDDICASGQVALCLGQVGRGTLESPRAQRARGIGVAGLVCQRQRAAAQLCTDRSKAPGPHDLMRALPLDFRHSCVSPSHSGGLSDWRESQPNGVVALQDWLEIFDRLQAIVYTVCNASGRPCRSKKVHSIYTFREWNRERSRHSICNH